MNISWMFRSRMGLRVGGLSCVFVIACALAFRTHASEAKSKTDFTFAILGDRTGGAFPGVYQEAWKETDADRPDFVINVGDTIQGGDDSTIEAEWERVAGMIQPYRKYRFFYVPGNHDVWSEASAQAYEKYTSRPLHYSFDSGEAHFTVLDNSRTDFLPVDELTFLKGDLEAHAEQKLKFIFFHRPSWILKVLLRNPDFPLHKLARQFGVQYIVCGHIHEMLRFELEGVTYLSMASSGGHLREPRTYARGWFFQHTLVTVHGDQAQFAIKELSAPFGEARVTKPEDWNPVGLKKPDSDQ